jgi:hypothetical protein
VARNSTPDIPFSFIPDSEICPVPGGRNLNDLPSSAEKTSSTPQFRQFLSKRKKWIWIGSLALLAIVIAAATAGGVVGSRNRGTSAQRYLWLNYFIGYYFTQTVQDLPKCSSELITNTFYYRFMSSSSSTASATQASTSASTNLNPSSTSGSSTSSDVNNAWAYNGSSIETLTFSTTSDTTGTNYVVFYQHSNGDIRQVVYNNSQWHSSQYITNDARPGSPITAYWGGDGIQYNLFYVDKNNVLQETRGSHASNSWLNGTLGQLSVLASDPGDISVVYVGSCAVGVSGWLLYSSPAGNQMGLLYWDASTDTWSHKGLIDDVKPGAGFAGHADIGVWRYYYVQQSTSELKEQVCPDCCSNSSSTGWRSGKFIPHLTLD